MTLLSKYIVDRTGIAPRVWDGAMADIQHMEIHEMKENPDLQAWGPFGFGVSGQSTLVFFLALLMLMLIMMSMLMQTMILLPGPRKPKAYYHLPSVPTYKLYPII